MEQVYSAAMAALEYNDKQYQLIEQIIIGRQKSCDIALLDQGASREHCKVSRDSKQRIWVEDLGSANGTRVNGDKIKAPTKLKDGDVIVCSKSSVTVQFDEADKEYNRTSKDIFNPEGLVGQLISGHRIQSVIGSTNIVTVYIARQLSLDREVVLKVVHPDFADAESPLAREIDEQTKLAARINHASIAQVHECGTEQNFIWSSMEYIEGEMLFDLLDREGQLTPDIALMLTEKIADGLQSAHEQGIVHRALNPRNIMLSNDGRIKVVYLILEQFLRYHLEQKGIPTPEDHADYLAPELIRSKKGDAKSDIYSLGCILFQILSGRPPYVFDSATKTAQAHIKDPIPNITEFCPDLPSSLQECISTMLHKNPEWRHQSMEDLKNDLEKIRKELPANISQQKARRVERPTSQRSPTVSSSGKGTGIFLNILIIAALGAGIWYLITQLSPENMTGGSTPVNHEPNANDDPNIITPDTDLSKIKSETEKVEAREQVERANKALDELWLRTKGKVDNAKNDNEWDSAEYILRRDLSKFDKSRRVTNTANSYLKQVLIDGRIWYDAELQKLTAGNSIQDLRKQCIELNNLRSKVLSESRADVDARYQQAITEMQRHLAKAKQAAISQVENGELAKLKTDSDALGKAFSGTVIEPMHRQFAALVSEAQRIKHLGDWSSTREQLKQVSGAEAILASGAALILSGNAQEGTKLLLQPSVFNTPALRKRRDVLVRSQAAILEFNDNSDLDALTFTTGQPALDNGFISGNIDSFYEIHSKQILGDQQWEIGVNLRFPRGLRDDSEFLIQIGNEEVSPITISLGQSNVVTVIETAAEKKETPSAYAVRKPVRIRCTYSNGVISVFLNSQPITEIEVILPNDAQLSLTSTACTWQIHQLMVLGAE